MSDESMDVAITPALPDQVENWQALPDAAAQVAMISGLIFGLFTGIGAAVFVGWGLRVLREMPFMASLLSMALTLLLFVVAGVWLGYRRWKHSFWKLDATGLHVKRGRLWKREILVPRSRVQHLDIERGPIERHFGLATLIVHTAGTRLHAVRQAGFLDADAVALRDALVPAANRHDDVL